MRKLGTLTLIAALLAPARARDALAAQRLVDVAQVASDTLRDVARARFEGGRPVIYYNPVLLQQFGPELAGFFLAHEYGHVRFGHTGAALVAGGGDLTALRQRQELEADCYAARALSEAEPESVAAAVRFFTRMGPFRLDAYHPSGSQRAAKILACTPAPGDTDAGAEARIPTFLSGAGRANDTPVGRPLRTNAPDARYFGGPARPGVGPGVDNAAAGR